MKYLSVKHEISIVTYIVVVRVEDDRFYLFLFYFINWNLGLGFSMMSQV